MRMGEGVEWALHTCVNLAWLGRAVPVAKLAALHDLPAAYLNKQLQALARAGIVTSVRGPGGGFQLARRPEKITLMDVVSAIEGSANAFQCTEIRRQGAGREDPANYRKPCSVSQAMRTAELAWRRELAGQTVADVKADAERTIPDMAARLDFWLTNTRD
jgi:Rrf2 family protein